MVVVAAGLTETEIAEGLIGMLICWATDEGIDAESDTLAEKKFAPNADPGTIPKPESVTEVPEAEGVAETQLGSAVKVQDSFPVPPVAFSVALG
jgi:hypothetical protein